MALEGVLSALGGDSEYQVPPDVQRARDVKANAILDSEGAPHASGPLSNRLMKAGKSAPVEAASAEPLAGALSALSDSTQPPPPPAGSASPVGSNTENALAGVGKTVADLGRGAKQLLDIPAQWLESKFPGVSAWAESKGLPSAKQSASDTNADVAESRNLDKPLMNTGAGIAGNIAGTIATTMIPLSAIGKFAPAAAALVNPTTYKAAAVAGALQGALTPTIEGESHADNALVGGAAGMAGNLAVNTIGRIAQPVAASASAIHQKAVDVLQKAGISLDAAQQSGSALLNRIRSGFSDNPLTVGKQAEFMGAQKSAYNSAVLKTIGEDATAATPDVMGSAQKRINGVFKDVLDRNNISINDTTLSRIGAVQGAAAESEKRPVVSIANRIINGVDQNGEISGQVAYGIKKDLDRLSSSADTDLAYHAKQLRSTLMDAINGSLSSEDRTAFTQARGQFANMKKIESAIDTSGEGNISPAKLANVMAQKRNRSISIYGNGPQDLVDLAHSGNLLLTDKLPNSGTAARLATQIVPSVIGAGIGSKYGDEAGLGAGTGALLGYGAGRGLQMLMHNPAAASYLSRGMQGGMTPLRDILLSPQTNPAIGGALRRLPLSAKQTTSQP